MRSGQITLKIVPEEGTTNNGLPRVQKSIKIPLGALYLKRLGWSRKESEFSHFTIILNFSSILGFLRSLSPPSTFH